MKVLFTDISRKICDPLRGISNSRDASASKKLMIISYPIFSALQCIFVDNFPPNFSASEQNIKS